MSIPEDEPDTADNDWDRFHANDETITERHPLREVLSCQKTWKNIAPPIKSVFDHLIDHMIAKDLEKHRWRRRLKRRNAMNQRGSVLTHRYCMRLVQELEANSEFLDEKIARKIREQQEQMAQGF